MCLLRRKGALPVEVENEIFHSVYDFSFVLAIEMTDVHLARLTNHFLWHSGTHLHDYVVSQLVMHSGVFIPTASVAL